METTNPTNTTHHEEESIQLLAKFQTLHDVGLELSSIQDLDELYQQIIIKARERLGFDRIGLFLVNLEKELLSGTYGINPDGELISIKHDVFNFSDGAWVKKIVYSQDRIYVREDTELLEGQEVIGRGWHLTASMKIRETLIGIIFADNMVSRQPFQPHLPELLAAYSTDAANLIDRLQTYNALRQSEQTLQEVLHQQKALLTVSQNLTSINDPDELYKQVIQQAQEHLGFDRLGLYLLDIENNTMNGTYGVDPTGKVRSEQDNVFSFKNEPWINNFIYNTDRIIVKEDEDLFERDQVIGRGWHMVAAIWQEDKPIGVLFADNLLSQAPLLPSQPDILTAYASTIAQLIDRIQTDKALLESEQTVQTFVKKQKELHEIGIHLSSLENPDELYREAIQLGHDILGYDRLGLHLLDSERKVVHGTFGIGVDGELRNEYHEVHVLADTSWMHRFLYHNERLTVNEDIDLFEDGKVVGHGWNLTATLWSQGQPIGLLFADNLFSQQPLQPHLPELLSAFSATIANLIERQQAGAEREQLLQDVARQAADLQTVADLGTQITSIQDPQKLMEVIVQETQKRFDLYHCHIFLVDESGKNLRIQACGWHPDAAEYGTHGDDMIAVNAKQSLVAQAARTKQAVLINDVANDPNWLPNKLLPDTRAELAVPMIVGDTVIGVLDVQSATVNRFESADLQIQSALAAQIAVALENARSLVRNQQVVAELDALTRRLTRESWEEYLSVIEEKDTGFVYSLGQLSAIDEADANELNRETAVPASNGHLSHSLMVHGEAIGHLTVFNEADTEQLDEDTALIMAAVAEQLSARVENIRLTEQTQQALAQTQEQAKRLGLLNEISAEMSNVETLNQVFDVVFARIPDLLKVDRVSLAMLQPDGETLEIIGHKGVEMNTPVGTRIPLADTPMAKALHDNRIIVSSSPSSDNIIKSSMIAPIFSAGQAIGTLNIGSTKANALTDREETLLQQLATMLSSIIENKQLLAAAQARAERERQVRTITDKIRRGVDREAILNIAQQEIGKLIGANKSAAQLGTKAQLLDRIQQTIEQTQQESG
ncbi:MAG: GAF domain-containing protein [Anaerolineae bacterium]|nr:GAF domain-containing protein [Anaerolineae bacterium]